jgi:hypothetical protein
MIAEFTNMSSQEEKIEKLRGLVEMMINNDKKLVEDPLYSMLANKLMLNFDIPVIKSEI